MARLRRRWRVVKWAGLVLSLLIGMAGLASLRWTLTYRHARPVRSRLGYGMIDCDVYGGWICELSSGRMAYERRQWAFEPGQLEATRRGTPDYWEPAAPIGGSRVSLPLSIPFLLTAFPTAFLWWRDRRIPPHCCQTCAYDLTGNVSGVCPECGERIER
jgi:hypothetical protein